MCDLLPICDEMNVNNTTIIKQRKMQGASQYNLDNTIAATKQKSISTSQTDDLYTLPHHGQCKSYEQLKFKT